MLKEASDILSTRFDTRVSVFKTRVFAHLKAALSPCINLDSSDFWLAQ